MKRSRSKAKQKTQEIEERVQELRLKNELLDKSIGKREEELKFLKDLFLTQAQSKTDQMSGIDIKKLLESDDDDDEATTSQSSKTKWIQFYEIK